MGLHGVGRERESDRSQLSECEQGGKSVRERGGSKRKGRVKQQAKWEREGEGENLGSVFFAPAGQKVTA